MSDSNPFSTDNVLDLAIKALRDEQPSLKTPYEAIALIGHACMAAVGFRLVGLGEDHTIGTFILHVLNTPNLIANLQQSPQRRPPSPQNGTLTVP